MGPSVLAIGGVGSGNCAVMANGAFAGPGVCLISSGRCPGVSLLWLGRRRSNGGSRARSTS